jgi:hypothetical protein
VVVVPLLILHAIARIVFVILEARLPVTIDQRYALVFAADFLHGLLYAAAMAVLVYFLMVPSLWGQFTCPPQPQFLGQQPPGHVQG